MSELTQIVWFIVLFPMVCAITIFVTVLAHNKAQNWYHQRFSPVATVDNNNVITLLKEQVDNIDRRVERISGQIVDAAKLFNKQGDDIKEIESALKVDIRGIKKKILVLKADLKSIKSDGYHWNVLIRKLSESEAFNINRMDSTEGDVRNIFSHLGRFDDEITKLKSNKGDSDG